jgi:hypothetical protein
MNVFADEVWFCFYDGFPIVRLVDRQLQQVWWNNPVHGAHGFAVCAGHVLFDGSYDDRTTLQLVSLDSMTAMPFQALQPDGQRIEARRGFGRGKMLFLETTHALHSVDIERLVNGG